MKKKKNQWRLGSIIYRFLTSSSQWSVAPCIAVPIDTSTANYRFSMKDRRCDGNARAIFHVKYDSNRREAELSKGGL
ncbi:hypothetical protein Y032_0158g3240 [Ancylostoma ceylanicum]|uniref:Uncharacterized protein n=1 Tax=Ancylostoma ceylanicum TaxID=53326 RepID=A0A016SYS0_9BILA|nr:hypothetical protein Y032_0158g3240 [Ancylostoma ceylanicum]